MEESTTEETSGSTAFSVRWPSALVERIDELAKADRRTRNNWLEVYLARSLDADRSPS